MATYRLFNKDSLYIIPYFLKKSNVFTAFWHDHIDFFRKHAYFHIAADALFPVKIPNDAFSGFDLKLLARKTNDLLFGNSEPEQKQVRQGQKSAYFFKNIRILFLTDHGKLYLPVADTAFFY